LDDELKVEKILFDEMSKRLPDGEDAGVKQHWKDLMSAAQTLDAEKAEGASDALAGNLAGLTAKMGDDARPILEALQVRIAHGFVVEGIYAQLDQRASQH
jgi:hypothetical protein